MKEHAKNALKHDINVMGKTVPTMIIIGLFLVGGGSAAILSSFGTVSGQADVTQAIQINGVNGEADLGYTFTDIVGGDVTVDTYTVTNNMGESYALTYTSTMAVDSTDEETDVAGPQVDWSDAAGGITTTYAQKFDAGHEDFSNYAAPSDSTTENNPGSISSSGIYTVSDNQDSGFTITQSDVVVAAASHGVQIDGTVTISADNVTLKGFEITADNPTSINSKGVLVTGKEVTVTQNEIHKVRAESRAVGVNVYSGTDGGADTMGTEVVNNKIYDVKATSINGDGSIYDESKSKGVSINSGDSSLNADGVDISYNTIQDIGNDTHSAMSNGVEIVGGYAQDFTVTYNEISDVSHKAGFYTPRAAGFYVTGYNQGEDYGTNHKVNYNNILLSQTEDTTDVKHWDNPDAGTLNAMNNYWGEDGIQYGVQDTLYQDNSDNSEIDVSWSHLDSAQPGDTTLAVVNEFPVYIDGSSSYTLTTTIS